MLGYLFRADLQRFGLVLLQVQQMVEVRLRRTPEHGLQLTEELIHFQLRQATRNPSKLRPAYGLNNRPIATG